jgi:hypothetical protein
MKLSQLKQLIKEEIQNEASIVYGQNNSDDFEKMLELDFGGDRLFIQGFLNFNNFDKWMENEIEMDLDEDPEEKKEYERLAKTYFNWKQKGLIDVYEMDIDDILTDVLSKPWKRISSFVHGAGNRVVIILTMF